MIATIPVTYPKETVVWYIQEIQSPLIIGISSLDSLTSQTKKTLTKVRPFGVILMGGNIKSSKQTKSLIKAIKQYGKTLGIDIKIAIDEEGGVVSRLSNLAGYPTSFTGASDESLFDFQKHAEYLNDIGVDINLAPVVDVPNSPDSPMVGRQLGNSTDEVSNKVENILPIYNKEGVESTLKHFPGLGRTSVDSHNTKPTVNITLEEWKTSDATPFVQGVEEKVENIMIGHVEYPPIDRKIATYSETWINILRNDLAFKGRIISDDLKMGAVDATDKIETRISKAYDAGITNPLFILGEYDTNRAYDEWIMIEKEKLKNV